ATRFHMTMPGYAPTRLAPAPETAASLGLERLSVKLEVERFGLPSFKILGASWATCRALSAHAGLDEPVPTFGRLQSLAQRVADGYGTIFAELEHQLHEPVELVAVQIGVGALASATVRALAGSGRFVLGVEPADADCALRAVRDGEDARAPGPHHSVMVGLNCGSVSPIALPDLRAGVDAFCAVDDDAVGTAVRALLDDRLTCGETGAAGVAGLVALRAAWGEESWSRLGV